MNYTKYGYRINQIKEGSDYTWLFLPGGPGLGSEYLIELCEQISLPGAIYLVDFPKDGTNIQGQLGIKYWQEGLIYLLKNHTNPILVTHSFSGMFSLNIPEIEGLLAGLILMNTITLNSFFHHVSAMSEQHGLPDLVPAASEYHFNPTNETYKQFWNTYKYYCFTAEEMRKGERMIKLFAFNNAAYYEAIEHFYPDYSCKWYPTKIPAMTIVSEHDFICPPQIFITNKHFHAPNILNQLIKKAGHCPWINYFQEIQYCFDQYLHLKSLLESPISK